MAGVAGGHAVAGRGERVGAGGFEVALERRKGCARGCRAVVRLLAGLGADARFVDGALEPFVGLGELAGGARLLGRHVPPLPLESLAAHGDVGGRAPVAVEQRVVALDRRLERRDGVAQLVAQGVGLGSQEARLRELRLGAPERGGRLRLAVAPLVPKALGLGG